MRPEDDSATKTPEMVAGYADPDERPPFVPYLAFMSIFGTLVGAALLIARRQGRELPAKASAGELLLVGTASHKLSRVISKDKVTSPLRAPFTELEGKGGPAELEERSRGSGFQKAFGELLICPYCLGLWLVAAFSVGLIFAPRLTRFIASLFSALTISDFFQIAYKAAEEKGLGDAG
ncbi:MAG TPA: DUF1360 domain-containing protein [Solirubrobacterales bacterium]|nr:DUF1360 domain-containing protein [Solirubrobacterales bacterium]